MNRNEYTADYRSNTEEVITTSGPMRHRIANFPDKQSTKAQKKSIQTVFACICLCLALTAIVLISLSHSGKFNISTPYTDENTTFENLIAPLVMLDPEPFDSTDDLNQDILLAASVWKATTSNPIFKSDNESNATISKEIVINAYQDLFGSVPENLLSTDHFSDFFKFNKDSDEFIILPYSNQCCYIPYIDSISSTGNSTNLTVWYVSPNDPWRSLRDDKPKRPEPSKKMIYTVKSVNNSFNIAAVHKA